MRSLLCLLSVLVVLFAIPHTTGATVQTAASLVATNNVSPGTICNAGSGAYTGNPTDQWGQVGLGTIARTYICIRNMGSGNYTVRITSTLSTPLGTISTPQSGVIIVPGAYALVEFDWTVPSTARLGQVSFTIMFRSK